MLDGAAMVTQRGEHWCCLLCLRQFDSLAKVRKHLIKSTMHAENLAAAVAAGRVSQPPDVSEAQSQGAKRHASASDPAEDPPARRAIRLTGLSLHHGRDLESLWDLEYLVSI